MKMHFDDLFSTNNGTHSPKVPVQIGGVSMTQGVGFSGGVSFGGIELAKHINHYFEVEIQNGMHVIKGVYE